MRYDEFILRVQAEGGLRSRDDAVRITRATLETIGERISRVHRQHLSAQLPVGLGAYPVKRKRKDLFMLDEFYNRVVARSEMGKREAAAGVHAVMQVLRQAIAPGELGDIFGDLPAEFDELLSRKATGAAPAGAA